MQVCHNYQPFYTCISGDISYVDINQMCINIKQAHLRHGNKVIVCNLCCLFDHPQDNRRVLKPRFLVMESSSELVQVVARQRYLIICKIVNQSHR